MSQLKQYEKFINEAFLLDLEYLNKLYSKVLKHKIILNYTLDYDEGVYFIKSTLNYNNKNFIFKEQVKILKERQRKEVFLKSQKLFSKNKSLLDKIVDFEGKHL